MAFFKMGVSVPIKNNQFRYGTPVYAEFGALYDATSLGPTTNIQNTTTNIQYILGAGDKVRLGPSTHASNVGAKQELEVSSVTASAITFTDDIIYAFSQNDPMWGVGSYFPQGWGLGYTSSKQTITKYNLYRLNNKSETSSDFGVDDYYAFKLGVKPSITYDNLMTIYQALGTDTLLLSTYYKVGFYYRITWNTMVQDQSIWAQVTKLNTSTLAKTNRLVSTELYQANGDVTTWTNLATSAFSTATDTSDNVMSRSDLDLMYVLFYYYGSSYYSTFSTYNTFWLDNIYMTHAKGTDGELTGEFTFTEYPTIGSQSWTANDQESQITLLSGSEKRFYVGGRVATKWTFSCRFENVSYSFYENLKVLAEWQRRGNELIFHTNELIGSPHPTVMRGFMSIPSSSQLVWDLGKVSFDFIFNQAD